MAFQKYLSQVFLSSVFYGGFFQIFLSVYFPSDPQMTNNLCFDLIFLALV